MPKLSSTLTRFWLSFVFNEGIPRELLNDVNNDVKTLSARGFPDILRYVVAFYRSVFHADFFNFVVHINYQYIHIVLQFWFAIQLRYVDK